MTIVRDPNKNIAFPYL